MEEEKIGALPTRPKLIRTKPEPVITLGRTIAEKINTEDVTKHWNTHCWKVIDAFFKQHGVVQQQVDSYNAFLDIAVRKIVQELPIIEVKSDECRYEFRFCANTMTISLPKHVEQDGSDHVVYPNVARLRNLTYASSIHCQIEVVKKEPGKSEEKLESESRKVRLIGYIPVMVRSNCCALKGKSDDQLQELNECPLDPGGYFIINGKERVIIAQERAANNTMFVFPRSLSSRNLLECEIRSTVEGSSASAHAFWVLLEQPKKVEKISKYKSTKKGTPRLKAKFPSLKKAFDIIILFQALGFENDRDIMKNIISLDNSPIAQKENSLIEPILVQSLEIPRCSSVVEAKKHMTEIIKMDLNEEDKMSYIDQVVLTKEFLPHLGVNASDCKKKGFFLCQMIRKLLMTFAGLRPFDDRDHLQNKRYYFAGPMISQLFFRSLRVLQSDMKKSLEIQLARNKKFSLDHALHTYKLSRFMSHCIASGVWGDARRPGGRIYKGVSQELNRFTYASLISSLRRIHSPEDKLHLMVKPRLLHNTYFGMICPCETPEGKSVGLVKNMALQSLISVGSNVEVVKTFLLENCDVKELMETIGSVTDIQQSNSINKEQSGNEPSNIILVESIQPSTSNGIITSLVPQRKIKKHVRFSDEGVTDVAKLELSRAESAILRTRIENEQQRGDETDITLVESAQPGRSSTDIETLMSVPEIKKRGRGRPRKTDKTVVSDADKVQAELRRSSLRSVTNQRRGDISPDITEMHLYQPSGSNSASEFFESVQDVKESHLRTTVVVKEPKVMLCQPTLLKSPKEMTKVYVNGVWVGFHDDPKALLSKLHHERKFGQEKVLPYEASLGWDPSMGEIDIRVDAGRMTRPLMVIQNNKLQITYKHIQKLITDSSYGWKGLLNDGLIEMIDVRESETTLIAMKPENLNERKVGYYMQYTHMEMHPSLMLGVCASAIPFANHNQSPRNVYQSGIAKQAMGVYITNYEARMDTTAHTLFYPQLPLSKTMSSEFTQLNKLPAGINCIVAIAIYDGYNQEDSIILNRAALDRGLFRSTYYHTYQDKADRNAGKGDQCEEFHRPNKEKTIDLHLRSGATEREQMIKYIHLDKDGIVPPGVTLMDDDCIIGKSVKLPVPLPCKSLAEEKTGSGESDKAPKKYFRTHRDASTYLKKSGAGEGDENTQKSAKILQQSGATVDRCLITTTDDGLRLVKVRMRSTLYPQIGDKFASLHGQKGVCGMIYGETDLPFTKQGIIPDIIINPHGMPSRMTIGQLYESLYGKAACLTGEICDGTAFDSRDTAKVENILKLNGFHYKGCEVMYNGFSGRKINTLVYIGPTYYQRLKHLVDDKIHSRGRGSVNILTRQPVQGFARDGGLRFGEMERDCVISHGTALFLMERLLGVSDLYPMAICNLCGYIVSSRPVHTGPKFYRCAFCPLDRNATEGISIVNVPYACKLFIQELMCMNISLKIVPNIVKGMQLQFIQKKPNIFLEDKQRKD